VTSQPVPIVTRESVTLTLKNVSVSMDIKVNCAINGNVQMIVLIEVSAPKLVPVNVWRTILGPIVHTTFRFARIIAVNTEHVLKMGVNVILVIPGLIALQRPVKLLARMAEFAVMKNVCVLLRGLEPIVQNNFAQINALEMECVKMANVNVIKES